MKMHLQTTAKFLCVAVLLFSGVSSQAAILFSENFDYPIGDNLAGQNGGTGFSAAWSGGNSEIVAGLGGTGNAVAIGSTITTRTFTAPLNTSGNTFYISYLMRSPNFFGGNFSGLSLWNGPALGGGVEQFFFGIPWDARTFGFAYPGVTTVDFPASNNTTYLVTLGLLPSATAGKVDVKMWATSDLSVDPDALVAGVANAQQIGLKDNFAFDRLGMHSNMALNLKLGGLATATTAAEAINFTVQSAGPTAVPEPGQVAASLVLLAGIGGYVWMKRRKTGKASAV